MTEDQSPSALAATHAAAFTQSRPWTTQEFADLLADRFTHLTGDGRAFALVREITDEAELLTIATHPDHQRQGHGTRIMQDWMRKAAQRGVTTAFLEVAADNGAAQALYSSCGFGLVGIRKAYYPRPKAAAADALLMKRLFP
ncbi:ribosomal protein S18-alanine N-acetyltransferase [Tritonibacter horizontis]|uniref:[Ribosomal protein bS18]-alanine N-acetyltransferase n=1 Tax=Tritonibacter horizontis TaxID=1768241 RepID=A0A132C2P8_9RHOB|nr:ribosomal protein S18-alanine N-acetyltransferase [Tritonibacter horizontis]KUP94397.1 mycothiol acetyltransferase [Tritonibacter horizontis]